MTFLLRRGSIAVAWVVFLAARSVAAIAAQAPEGLTVPSQVSAAVLSAQKQLDDVRLCRLSALKSEFYIYALYGNSDVASMADGVVHAKYAGRTQRDRTKLAELVVAYAAYAQSKANPSRQSSAKLASDARTDAGMYPRKAERFHLIQRAVNHLSAIDVARALSTLDHPDNESWCRTR